MSAEQVGTIVSYFFCEQNHDIQHFLYNTAIRFEQANKARTYFIVDAEQLEAGSICILAYFTIAIKNIDIGEGVSATKRRKLDGIRKDAKTVVCYLIGQLGKNDRYRSEIQGTKVLGYALAIIQELFETVGGRFVLIECEDNEKLIDFYKRNGFEILQKDDLVQMIRYLPIQSTY